MTGERASVDRLLTAVQALTTSNDMVSGQLERLKAESAAHRRYGRRNRHLIWVLAAAVVLLLTTGVVINGVRTSNASDLARQVHATQVSTCQQANATRAQQLQIWDYVLAVPQATPPTAAQEKIRADFRAFVHRVFAARDCSRI